MCVHLRTGVPDGRFYTSKKIFCKGNFIEECSRFEPSPVGEGEPLAVDEESFERYVFDEKWIP